MNLLLFCLCAMLTLLTLAFGNPMDLDFKRTAKTGSMNRFQTVDLSDHELSIEFLNDDQTQEKRGLCLCGGDTTDKCQSGYVNSKYCRIAAEHCFGKGQVVHVSFSKSYQTPPKVMIGLTLIDTNKNDNVRVRASVKDVTKHGFNILFNPWVSHTYQIGVNWMACP